MSNKGITVTDPGPLNSIVRNSLDRKLSVHLRPSVSIRSVQINGFLMIQKQQSRFFYVLASITLNANDGHVLTRPPRPRGSFLRRILTNANACNAVALVPVLVFARARRPKGQKRGIITGKGAGACTKLRIRDGTRMRLLPIGAVPTRFDRICRTDSHSFQVVFN